MSSPNDPPTLHSLGDHVLGQIGLHAGGSADACGSDLHLHLSPLLLEEDGHVDFGVLGVFLDLASGHVAGLRPFLHADIGIHRIARPAGELLRVESRVLREGKRTAIVHLTARDDQGVLVADSTQQLAFPTVKVDPEVSRENREALRAQFMSQFDGQCRLPGRMHDIIGLQEEAGPDGSPHWTMPLTVRSRNTFGGLHGGVAFDLVTEAAAGAADRVAGPVEAKSALLRYLAPATGGPMRAVPTVLPQDDGSVFVRVEVHDDGKDGRLCIVGEVHLAARR
ncbi:MAG TPA: hypothetical protein VIR58_10965 [Acidimicrobiales bacterium]